MGLSELELHGKGRLARGDAQVRTARPRPQWAPNARSAARRPTVKFVAYRDNHIISQSYLARWASDHGRLATVTPPAWAGTLRKPRSVGYRRNFWGRDPAARRHAEEQINKIESSAKPAIDRLKEEWPFDSGSRDRHTVAYLVAVHLWRTPAGHEHFLRLQRDALRRRLPEHRKDWTPRQTEEFLREVTSDKFRVESFLERLLPTVSVLASMHWTYLVFGDPLLATSDQPISVFPLNALARPIPLTAIPPGAFLDTYEVRIALGPSEALLFTWLDERDDVPPVLGDDAIAAQLNRAVIAQADRQWFYDPRRRPTRLTPGLMNVNECAPIATRIYPSYSQAVAVHAQRRQLTRQNLDAHYESADETDTIAIVGVERAAA
jgi:hypothetical protein